MREPITHCEPPTLVHRPIAVWTMVAVSWVLFAFAGTYTRLARGGNPWAGFVLGGLLGIVGVLAAAVVPPSQESRSAEKSGPVL